MLSIKIEKVQTFTLTAIHATSCKLLTAHRINRSGDSCVSETLVSLLNLEGKFLQWFVWTASLAKHGLFLLFIRLYRLLTRPKGPRRQRPIRLSPQFHCRKSPLLFDAIGPKRAFLGHIKILNTAILAISLRVQASQLSHTTLVDNRNYMPNLRRRAPLSMCTCAAFISHNVAAHSTRPLLRTEQRDQGTLEHVHESSVNVLSCPSFTGAAKTTFTMTPFPVEADTTHADWTQSGAHDNIISSVCTSACGLQEKKFGAAVWRSVHSWTTLMKFTDLSAFTLAMTDLHDFRNKRKRCLFLFT